MVFEIARSLGARILIDSESNTSILRERKVWFYNEEMKTAKQVMDRNTAIKSQGYGRGFTYLAIHDFVIFSCHSSGNDNIETIEKESLLGIENVIRTTTRKAITAGDFNAKSPPVRNELHR